jgi:hypothetical protein
MAHTAEMEKKDLKDRKDYAQISYRGVKVKREKLEQSFTSVAVTIQLLLKGKKEEKELKDKLVKLENAEDMGLFLEKIMKHTWINFFKFSCRSNGPPGFRG